MKVRYWDSLADDFASDVFEITERDLNRVIAGTARRLGGERLVAGDFGCGAGASARAIAPYFGKVVALDFSEKLLDVARAKTTAENIEYRKADLTKKLSPEYSCDVAFCFNVLIMSRAKDRAKIAANVVSTLKKDGAGVFIVPSIESELRSFQIALECRLRAGWALDDAVKEIDKGARREIVSLSQGLITLGGAPTKHFFGDEIVELLQRSALGKVSLQRVHYPWDVVLDDIQDDIPAAPPWDWMAIGRKPE